MANQARRAAGGGTGRKSGRGVMTAVLLLPVAAVLFPTCVVLACGMAPSIVAYVVDRSRAKYLTITVALMNFSGTLPGIGDLWQQGHSLAAATMIAGDPFHWLSSYGAASVGWLIFLTVPPILKAFYVRTTMNRIDSLRRKQAALVETWGDDISAPGTPNDPDR